MFKDLLSISMLQSIEENVSKISADKDCKFIFLADINPSPSESSISKISFNFLI